MKSYFITDPKYYNSLEEFESLLINSIKNHQIDYICFRDKINKNIESYAKLLSNFAKKQNIKSLINSNIDLAIKYNFDGVHLTSNQFNKIKIAKEKNLFTIISTHSLKEALKAQYLKADAITYSPIFYTPNKAKPKGIKDLENVVKIVDIKCFALGGIINKAHIFACKKTNCFGFASIRYFVSDL